MPSSIPLLRLLVAPMLLLGLAPPACKQAPRPGGGRQSKERRLINAIHFSSRAPRSLAAAKKLLAQGAAINGTAWCYSGHRRTTPLIEAVHAHDDGLVALLIKRGAKINLVPSKSRTGWTPLHYAVETGQYYVIAVLVARGAKLDAVGKSGLTPLHLAAARDKPGVVKLLLRKGAAVNLLDKRRRTPLDYANYESIRDVLIKAGAKRARAFREAPPKPAPG